MKHITIVGLGYIGLPTALLAARHNEVADLQVTDLQIADLQVTDQVTDLQVVGFDTDPQKIAQIKQGISPIQEPGIQDLLKNTTLVPTTTLTQADCFVITVPTPLKKEDKTADLSCVFHAATAIAKKIRPGNLVILESTVPVGTTAQVATHIETISGLKKSIDFFVAHCPERVLPGNILYELVHNDRIIGGICDQSASLAKTFYKTFVTGECILTDDKTAEMSKLVENSYRDLQIAFANQLASMCNTIDIDPFTLIALANKHPRISILQPGCGVGGHCIAVDPWFLIQNFPHHTSLLQQARKINDEKPKEVIKNVQAHAENKKTLVLGLTFKPDTDDLRESPALYIAQTLHKSHDTRVHDPYVSPPSPLVSVKDLHAAINDADIVVLLVKHSFYKDFFTHNPGILANKIVIDPCGLKEFYEATLLTKGQHQARRCA